MAESFIRFTGQLNPNTSFLGQLSPSPTPTGRTTDYFYHNTFRNWQVGVADGWEVVADPSALIGATIISLPSDIEGNFRDNLNGVRYLVNDTLRGWYWFFSRTEEPDRTVVAAWPPAETDYIHEGSLIFNPFLRTQNSTRLRIRTPGWIKVNYSFHLSEFVTLSGTPQFSFLYGKAVGGDFFFILNGGETLQATANLSSSDVRTLYNQGKLFLETTPYRTDIGDNDIVTPLYIYPPADAQYMYATGLVPAHIYPETRRTGYSFNGSTFSSEEYGEDSLNLPERDPPTCDDCKDFVFYLEHFGFCKNCPPPSGGLPSPGDGGFLIDCPTEFFADSYRSQKRRTFYPLELK